MWATLIVISNKFHGYDRLRFTDYIHLKIDHSKMFVDDDIYTNTVESFWAIVKRAVYGIYFTFEEVFTAIY